MKINKILRFDEIESTNALAKDLYRKGKLAKGSALFANKQSKGRGRLGTDFASQGGIYLSLLVQPMKDIEMTLLVTLATGVGVKKAIEKVIPTIGKDISIKWINDIYIENKKVSGILVEAISGTQGIEALIIGVGINTDENTIPDNLKSRADIVPLPQDPLSKKKLERALIEEIPLALEQIEIDRTGLLDYYRKASYILGKNISVSKKKKGNEISADLRKGKALDIDELGGLLVLYDDGTRETLRNIDVSIRLD